MTRAPSRAPQSLVCGQLGHDGLIMTGLLVVFFPFLLLAFMLFMERVEAPLRAVADEVGVEDFLDHARPAEVATLHRFGIRRAIEAMRSRRGSSWSRPTGRS